MKFAKDLIKVENWCKKHGLNIDRMKSDTYMYQVYTCVDDCLYIEQVNYKKTIKFYCVYNTDGMVIGSTGLGNNRQSDLIKLLESLIFNKNVKKEDSKEINKESKNVDNEKEFTSKIKHVLRNNLSNAIFDKYYDGENYNKLANNLNDYINTDTIVMAINNAKDYIKEYCKIYNKPCKLELEGNFIYMNNNKINISF